MLNRFRILERCLACKEWNKKVCYLIFVWNQSCYVIWMSDLQFKHITGIYLQYEHPTNFSVFILWVKQSFLVSSSVFLLTFPRAYMYTFLLNHHFHADARKIILELASSLINLCEKQTNYCRFQAWIKFKKWLKFSSLNFMDHKMSVFQEHGIWFLREILLIHISPL